MLGLTRHNQQHFWRISILQKCQNCKHPAQDIDVSSHGHIKSLSHDKSYKNFYFWDYVSVINYFYQIIDSIMALFRVDFCGRGELADRQQKLAQMLSRLQKLSEGELHQYSLSQFYSFYLIYTGYFFPTNHGSSSVTIQIYCTVYRLSNFWDLPLLVKM